METSKPRRSFRWWHAVLIFVIANGISALPAGYGGEEAFYNSFQLPSIAPPDWLFPPMWFFLNITSLMALSIIANRSESSRPRTIFLWCEGIGWILFSVFSIVYFGMKSPILGAIDTVLGLIVALGSLIASISMDRRAAFMIGFRVIWLLLASYVAVWAAMNNVDPYFVR